jgi:hypothetical protein
MNNFVLRIVPTLFALGLILAFPGLLFAEKPVGELEFAGKVVVRDSRKALVKTDLEIFRKLYGLAGNDPDLKRKVTEELGDSLAILDRNAKAAERFINDLRRVGSKEDLMRLMEGKKLRAYAESVLEETAANLSGHGDEVLRKMVGLTDGGVDKAGREALALLRRAEREIAERGALGKDLGERLAGALRKLPPERAGAARQLVRNRLAAGGKGLFNVFLRTGVDGLFVLGDAYAIAGLENEEEKAAQAGGAMVGYGLDTVGNVAVRALGGGGFLHGLVVSWSSGKVAELVTEVVLLQYDRENAAKKAEWADMELRLDVIRGMLKVDGLLKAGELDKARTYLAKVRRFYFKHTLPGEGLYEKMEELEQNIDQAGRRIRANEIIAEARIPYMQGYRLASRGRALNQARVHVREAQKILQASLRAYPELQGALQRTTALLSAIEKLIAGASPLGPLRVAGPDTVRAGEFETYTISAAGGIPDYHPVGMNGLALPSGALVYWQAPDRPGRTTVTFRVRDDTGQQAEVKKEVEVVSDIPSAPAGTDLRLHAHYVRPGYRENGRIVENQNVEAREVFTWTEVYYQLNVDSPEYRYVWRVNGKTDPDTWAHTFWLRPEKPGIYTVRVDVSDASGKPLGSAEWVLTARDMELTYPD